MKKKISCLLMLVILLSCFSLPVKAASNSNISVTEITQKLSSWKANLNGKYWNYYDRSVYDGQRAYVKSQLKAIATSGALSRANATNAELGVTSSACGGSLYENGCRSNYFDGWQCFGFGVFVEYALFQSTHIDNPTDWYVYSGNDLSSISLQPGDYVRFNNHTIIIADTTNNALNCVEAWGGSGCKISWSPGFNWSEYTTASGLLSAMKSGGGTVYRYKYIGDGTYLAQCTPYPTHLKVKVTEATTLKSLPCSKSTDSESADVYTPAIGKQYTVTKLYKNSVGNYWYETSYNGTTCYLYAGDAEIVEYIGSSTITGVSAPSALNVGDRFSIKGVIYTEKTELYQVGVNIKKDSETILQAYEPISSGTNSYSLLNSSVDLGITFNTLPAGNYAYIVYKETRQTRDIN